MNSTAQPLTISPLLSWLVTTNQVTELQVLIEEKLRELATAKTTKSLHSWLSLFPSPVVEVWPILFPSLPSSLEVKPNELSAQLKSVAESLAQLPVTQITVAFSPTAKQCKEYVTLLRAQLHDSLLLNITVDESIIGGCQLSYQGQKLSSTLKDRLETL